MVLTQKEGGGLKKATIERSIGLQKIQDTRLRAWHSFGCRSEF
jgi:hypothetical protein